MLDRKLAAWILMVPGPWRAATRSEALVLAAQAFGAGLSPAQFDERLHRAGYDLVVRNGAFALQPREDDLGAGPARIGPKRIGPDWRADRGEVALIEAA